VARVKIWNAEGRILYSDEPRLIGQRFQLAPDELEALRSKGTSADVANLSDPENRYERGMGDLTSVYLGLRAKDGTPVMFEEYLRSGAIASNGRTLARAFAPVGIVALLVIALLQIPLAWRMARRITRAQLDREQLLERAVDASDRERRVIAAGLHDGVVQELAGQSFRMAAALERQQPPDELRLVLAEGAAGIRNAIRQLRSLLLEIYPPALREQGLPAALPDLVAPLSARGVDVTVNVPDGLALPSEVERLIFRTAQEAIRNATSHAAAAHVRVDVARADGTATLRVTDDGRGFDEADLAQRRADGHLGLDMLRDLAASAGGTLEVTSARGEGTTVELEVPAS
jgi:signal transduction histidine kinase